MSVEREVDAVVDAGGAVLTVAMLDRLIARVWEAASVGVVGSGGHPSQETTIISHPAQRIAYNSTLFGMNEVEIEWIKQHILHDQERWILDTNFPTDQVRVEFRGKAGIIKNLATIGY